MNRHVSGPIKFSVGKFFRGIKMFSRMKVPGLRGFPHASKCYEISFRYKLKEFPDTKISHYLKNYQK